MKYHATLIAVRDMPRAIRFYREVLGLSVEQDFGANVTLTGGIALQTRGTWAEFLHKSPEEITLPHHAGELYFEEDDFDGFLQHLARCGEIRYVHPPREHAWGQRVVRFFDPDGHIIEVGENIAAVARRFLSAGLTEEGIAKRMDVPIESVRQWLA